MISDNTRSINRNIVECKVCMSVRMEISHRGINRNIVECKDRRLLTVSGSACVLIET